MDSPGRTYHPLMKALMIAIGAILAILAGLAFLYSGFSPFVVIGGFLGLANLIWGIRLKTRPVAGEADPGFPRSAMVVVAVLLVGSVSFFAWRSPQRPPAVQEGETAARVPPQSGVRGHSEPIEVLLQADGVVRFQGRRIELNAIGSEVATILGEDANATVTIVSGPEVSTAHLVAVMDQLRAADLNVKVRASE